MSQGDEKHQPRNQKRQIHSAEGLLPGKLYMIVSERAGLQQWPVWVPFDTDSYKQIGILNIKTEAFLCLGVAFDARYSDRFIVNILGPSILGYIGVSIGAPFFCEFDGR